MNLRNLIGRVSVGQRLLLTCRYDWFTPSYTTVGYGQYSSISDDYIDFNGNITFRDLGAYNLSLKLKNSREYEMYLNGISLEGTYGPGSDWDLSVDSDKYKGTIYMCQWDNGLWFQPKVTGIGPLSGSKFWIGAE